MKHLLHLFTTLCLFTDETSSDFVFESMENFTFNSKFVFDPIFSNLLKKTRES